MVVTVTTMEPAMKHLLIAAGLVLAAAPAFAQQYDRYPDSPAYDRDSSDYARDRERYYRDRQRYLQEREAYERDRYGYDSGYARPYSSDRDRYRARAYPGSATPDWDGSYPCPRNIDRQRRL